jgi:hypothetical protein
MGYKAFATKQLLNNQELIFFNFSKVRSGLSFKKFTFLSHLILIFCLSSLNFTFAQTQTCDTGGDETTYGIDKWIGYVYQHVPANFPLSTPVSNDYRGYVTENELFDRDWESASPSCSNNDNFSIRYKMNKTFACGTYRFILGGDDGVRLSLDGGATWLISKWTNTAYTTVSSAPISMSGNTNLVLEYYERTGLGRVSFGYATLPFAAGVSAGPDKEDCNGGNIVLNGSFNTNDPSPTYLWSGGPIVSGGNTLTPTVNPTSTTTYTLTVTSKSCTASDDVLVTVGAGLTGNPADFGDNVWNVYGYNGSSTTLSNNTYRGFYVQPSLSTTNFGVNTQNFWSNNKSPSDAGTIKDNKDLWQGCGSVNDNNHTFTSKRQGFPCGNYTFKFNNWDDETRLYIDGVSIWSCGAWSGSNSTNNSNSSQYACAGGGTFTVKLDANSRVEFQTFEVGGGSNLSVDILGVTPTALAGSATRTCAVKGSSWNHFYNDQNQLIASILIQMEVI